MENESVNTLFFFVNEFGISYEDEVTVLGFSEGEDSENCLLLQFSDDLNESDIKLGHTKYYIGSCDGTVGNYDCLEKIMLNENSIEFIFKSANIAEFGFTSVIVEMKKEDFENAQAVIIEHFENVDVEIIKLNSSNLNERFINIEETNLVFPQQYLSYHTEANILREVRPEAGQTLTITGQLAPCLSCKSKMHREALEGGYIIIYLYRYKGKTRIWQTGT